MEQLFQMTKRMKGKHFPFLALFFLWVKSYIVLRFVFELPIENMIEELILLINPLGFLLLLFSLIGFSKKKKRAILVLSSITTFVLYANMVYYRFFNDFITIPVLFQFKNFGDLGGSAIGLMEIWDVFLFMDLVLLYLLTKKQQIDSLILLKYTRASFFGLSIIVMVVNIGLAETQRPQLLTRTFDRELLVKYLGVYNYHIYDSAIHTFATAQRTFAESTDIVEVENYTNQKKQVENSFTNIADGKNVILISLESFQNFLIDYKLNGEEVTPFLNDLTKSSYYFDNFYHQTMQGKTSDSEFVIDNSLFPLPSGAVFTTRSQNEYYAIPEILGEHDYTTAVFHGNNKSFWNRDIMYETLGYDRFYSERDYIITEENSINYGLKDIPFFTQSIQKLQNVEQPFYAKFLTLTNHYPYLVDKEDTFIGPHHTGDGSVDRYFQTARYLDKAIELFFQDLKDTGLYEDSIIILYGDHYGISANHNKAMEQVIGKEITPFEHIQLQRVPLIVHIPGHDGQTISKVAGQIDLKPTILNLLGIKVNKDIQFGEDLFSNTKTEMTILRDGSFITDDYVFTEESCFDKATGLETDLEKCSEYKAKVNVELELSDKVINGDLLRFAESSSEKIK